MVAALVALGCGCVDDGGGTPPSLPDTGQAEDAADGGALAPDAVADPGGGIPADAPRPDPGPPDPGRKAELGFEIGQSCRGNEDCPGGWCVELEEGASVCTLSCFQECPTGWTCRQVGGLGPDAAFVCVPLPSDVCAQCSSSEGCGVLGLCAESPEGGGRCLLACGVTGGHCSSGFACAERAEEPSGDTVEVCAPVGTTACCAAATAGLEAPCSRSNEHGTCSGNQVCRGVQGWTTCDAREPEAELCNGGDDDCDGHVDEGFAEGCACGDGVCAGGGHEDKESCPCDCHECGDGVCTPCGESPERCPEDCCVGEGGERECGDGTCTGPVCGEDEQSCPQDCSAQCGNGSCDRGENPRRCPADCRRGSCGNLTCEPADGGAELCPSDCGQFCGDCVCSPVAERPEAWDTCPSDCGYCGDGVCSGCPALAEDPVRCPEDCCVARAEVCNGVDDDCDGRTDEDFWVGQSCDDDAPSGVCVRGVRVCEEVAPGEVSRSSVCADAGPKPAGAPCGAYVCRSGYVGLPGSCDGQGSCVSQGWSDCGGEVCADGVHCAEGCEVEAGCRRGYACVEGECVEVLDECLSDADCIEGDPCTLDICDLRGVCATVPRPPCGPEDDADADGVLNRADLCPEHADSAQDDDDGDGIGDACDPCVAEGDHETRCDGADEDCDGETDEDFGVGETCADAGNPCARFVRRCVGEKESACEEELLGVGARCAEALCSEAVLTDVSECDAEGECTPRGVWSCAPFTCADEWRCHLSCEASGDCYRGTYCLRGACVPTDEIGTPCIADEACTSGRCADGFCCEESCAGSCRTCATPGAAGRCVPVVSGEDADTCAGDRRCDAAGVCRLELAAPCRADVECLSELCRDDLCCEEACDGLCESCALPGRFGVCAPVRLDQDRGSCEGAFGCDASARCRLTTGQPCAGDGACISGFCVDGVCCRTACGEACMRCDRPGNQGTCVPRTAGEDSKGCSGVAACDGAGRCRRKLGATCSVGGDCLSGYCSEGVCCDARCVAPCRSCVSASEIGACGRLAGVEQPERCADGAVCSLDGVCVQRRGQPCGDASECNSGHCVDGFCCDLPCGGVCEACDVGGREGECTALPEGTDRDAECGLCRVCDGGGACAPVREGEDLKEDCAAEAGCGRDGSCDGAGGCRLKGGETACGEASCAGATFSPADTCDGRGACADGGVEPCPGGYACDEAAGACRSACATGADCAAGHYCTAAVCLPEKEAGQPCRDRRECASGVCTDGVCCAEECKGACVSCALTGLEGSCELSPRGQDPRGACGGARVCDGLGACRAPDAEPCDDPADCLSDRCVDGLCCEEPCEGACEGCALEGEEGRCVAYEVGGDPDGECPGSSVCGSGGRCVGPLGASCSASEDCLSGICAGGTCCEETCEGACMTCALSDDEGRCRPVPRGSGLACPAGMVCDGGGACARVLGAPCSGAEECLSGFCADGLCCESACRGICLSCAQPDREGRCHPYEVGTDPDSECGGARICDGVGGCVQPEGGSCLRDADCLGGRCVDGSCCPGGCPGLCRSCGLAGSRGSCTPVAAGQDPDSECEGTALCDGRGQCAKPVGAVCGAGAECLSGHCTDGVCCATACADSCMACDLPSRVGVCAAEGRGASPAGDCAEDQVCDGEGGCVSAGAAACAGAEDCLSGHCVDGRCCEGPCEGPCMSCAVPESLGLCVPVPAGEDLRAACAEGKVCNGAGLCVGEEAEPCGYAGQCLSGHCVDGVCCEGACDERCRACNLSGSVGSCADLPRGIDPSLECAGAEVCDGEGGCVSPNGHPCSDPGRCLSGHCVDGVCCGTACDGLCERCDEAGRSGQCAPVQRGGDPAAECAGEDTCDGAGGCVSAGGAACGSPAECLSGHCVDDVCCESACEDSCYGCAVAGAVGSCAPELRGQDPGGDCPGEDVCDGAGECVKQAGEGCSGAESCLSGHCADGVCCDVACEGLCEACAGLGDDGSCAPVGAGEDPENECAGLDVCDGARGCKSFGGETCAVDGECLSGHCADGICCDDACVGACESCALGGSEGTCTAVPRGQDPDEDCAGEQVCDGGSGCVRPAGAGCAVGGECLSGRCADEVCCDAACDGLCESCALDGSGGACTKVSRGEDPDAECDAEQVCDGAGGCVHPDGVACGGGGECLSGRCVDGVCCDAACDGLCESCALEGSIGACAPIDHGDDPGGECAGLAACDGAGACVRPDGEGCGSGTECLSGRCVDGLCCDAACDALCASCALSELEGRCSPIPRGSDPAGECPGDETCDGASGCVSAGGTACGSGAECVSGHCVDGVCCETACDEACVACDVPQSEGRCSPVAAGSTDGACAAGTLCDGEGACKLEVGGGCGLGADCLSGHCVDGVCCDAACDGLCETCAGAGSAGSCVPVAARADPAEECPGTQACDGAGACARPEGLGCSVGADCLSGHCVDEVCCDGPCDASCFACDVEFSVGACAAVPSGDDPKGECPGVSACDGAGGCRRPDGLFCLGAHDCLSGHCIDGLCCDTACDGLCVACDLSGSEGVCTALSAETDPAGECGLCRTCSGVLDGDRAGSSCTSVGAGKDPLAHCASELQSSCGRDGTCDGDAACRLWASGTVCVSPSCDPGTNAGHVADTCDGAGACVDEGSGVCEPYVCDDSRTACRSSCSEHLHCDVGYFCSSTSCEPRKQTGVACGSGAECASGVCEDGLCCDGVCGGLCESCAVAGSEGSCAPVLRGEDPDNECPGTEVCDGAGVCVGQLGAACGHAGDCLSGHCRDEVCCDEACTRTCVSCARAGLEGSCSPFDAGSDPEGECTGAEVCDGGSRCVRPTGEACSAGGDCLSAHCVDGVCCAEASCPGTCVSCADTVGVPGDCAYVPRGEDPDAECPGDDVCDGGGSCVAPDGSACGGHGECFSGSCADGVCCDEACDGQCRRCDGASPGSCVSVVSAEDPDTCAGLHTCDASGACLTKSGQACAADGECASGFCTDEVCCDTRCDGSCRLCDGAAPGTCEEVIGIEDPGTCEGSSTCDATGQCKPKAGEACDLPGDCATGFCVDGVCCNTACGGTCAACDLSGTEGICAVVPHGLDPDSECPPTKRCDGAGACLTTNGAACLDDAGCLSGHCTDGVCCVDAECPGTCRSCALPGSGWTCADYGAGTDPEAECEGPQVCDGAGACVKPVGYGCSEGGDCLSGHCADGYCCNNACDNTCEVCDLLGFEGQCKGVDRGTDPDAECPGALLCDGAGACKNPVSEACAGAADCLSGHCVDERCCDTACDALCHACDVVDSPGRCTAYAYGDDPDSECPAGGACDGAGGCVLAAGAECEGGGGCLSGHCVDGYCCDSACDGPCEGCDLDGKLGACSPRPNGTDAEGDCPAEQRCDGAGGCLLDLGQPCEAPEQCWSRFCEQGVCCDGYCTEPCQSCTMGAATGTCTSDDGVPCEDGDFCTLNDSCAGGECAGGAPVACGDGNVCTADSCDPAAGCVNEPGNEGLGCDDSLECTLSEVCAGGSCASATDGLAFEGASAAWTRSADGRADSDLSMAVTTGGTWLLAVASGWSSDGGLGEDSDILVSRSTDGGRSWSAPGALDSRAGSDLGEDRAVVLAAGAGEDVVAVWQSSEDIGGNIGADDDIVVSASSDGGQTWTLPVALNSGAASDQTNDTGPALATDATGLWVAAWSSSVDAGGIGLDEDILYARSTDKGGTWSAATRLNTNAATDVGDDYAPALATDGAGNWVCVWLSHETMSGRLGADSDVLFARSTDNAQSWSPPEALSSSFESDSGGELGPRVAADSSAAFVVLFGSGDTWGDTLGADLDILGVRSANAGQSWSEPSPVNSDAGGDSADDEGASLATDGEGTWLALFVRGDEGGAEPDLYAARSRDGGRTWAAPTLVLDDSGADFEDRAPALAHDGGGAWRAAWLRTSGLSFDGDVHTARVAAPPHCDDELACTDDVCTEVGDCASTVVVGCLVEGVCYAEGPDPDNPCRECAPATSRDAWVLAGDDTPCLGAGRCVAGQCRLPELAAPDLVDASDTGRSSSDDLTGDSTPSVRVDGIAAGETVSVVFARDGSEVARIVTNDGADDEDANPTTVTASPSSALADGEWTVTATADPFSPDKRVSAALVITVDATAPQAPPAADLRADSDSGRSSSDDTTKVTTPCFDLTGEQAAFVNLLLVREGTGDTLSVVSDALSDTGLGTVCISVDSPLPEDGTWEVAASQSDRAGNTSEQSVLLEVLVDTAAPAKPSIDASTPTSPNSDATPQMSGTAEASGLVEIFFNASCAGTLKAQVLSPPDSFWSQEVTVASNAVTTAYARVTDTAGNASPCSAGYAYVHDDIPPAKPVLTGTLPESPSNTSTSPKLSGQAEAGATVRVYTSADCSGGEAATAVAEAARAFEATLTVPANSATSLKVTATDAAGNVSPCSDAVVYVHDDVAPAAPTLTGSSPSSPGPSRAPQIEGTTEPAAVARLYGTADCSGEAIGNATAVADGSFSIEAAVERLSSKSFYATATDPAGNLSGCSAAFTYEHLLPDGSPCADAALCHSGLCVDQTCCASACELLCQACNVPGSEGSCVDIPRVETAASPSARSSAAMVYDSARGRAVLFGGNSLSTALADTWEHDGTRWVEITPTDPEGDGNPPALYAHAMACDSARERVVLFGGTIQTGDGVGESEQIRETWEYDGESWAKIVPTDPEGDGKPTARYSHAMAFDATREKVVLFGGERRVDLMPVVESETWVYDGASWQELNLDNPSVDPPGARGGAMAWSQGDGKVLHFGGYSGLSASQRVHHDELWAWDGASWAQITVSGSSPAGRAGATLSSGDSKLWLYGGISGTMFPFTTYSAPWTYQHQVGWTRLSAPADTPVPPERSGHAAAYHEAAGVFLIFGGGGGGLLGGHSDTWVLDASIWRSPDPSDPDEECGLTSVCNGAGQCSVDNGVACAADAECTSGFCVDGVCCATACGEECMRCDLEDLAGTCSPVPNGADPDDECVGDAYCNGAGGCLFVQGQPCAAGADCELGYCVDGYCCDLACGLPCRRCDSAGTEGTCEIVRSGDDDGACAAGCTAAGICPLSCGSVAGLQAGAPWPMEGQCPTRQGRSPYVGPRDNTRRYRHDLPSAPTGEVVIGAGDKLVVPLDSGKLWVAALDGTGEVTHDLPAANPLSTVLGSDGSFHGLAGAGVLYALTAGGTEDWKLLLAGGVSQDSALVIAGDKMIYLTNGPWLSQVDDTPSQPWKAFMETAALHPPLLSLDGQTVYFTGVGGVGGPFLMAYTVGGTAAWAGTKEIGGEIAVGASGNLYSGTHSYGSGGTLLWEHTQAVTGEREGPTAIAPDGSLRVASGDGYLYAIEADGSERWKKALHTPAGRPTVDAEGTAYVADGNAEVHAWGPDGTALWTYEAADFYPVASPAMASDGSLAVVDTSNWRVHVIGPCSGDGCLLLQGAACARDHDCTTGYCVDAVCCDTACPGPCEACDQAGAEGACTAHDLATNPEAGCDDGNPCTVVDTCAGGECLNAPYPPQVDDTAAVNTDAAADAATDSDLSLARDGSGNWVAAWPATSRLGPDSDVFFARSADGGASWSAPAALNPSAPTDGSGDLDTAVSVAGGGTSTFVAAWSAAGLSGSDTDIYLVRSEDGGQTWSAPAPAHPTATTDAGYDFEPSVAGDASGNFVLAWVSYVAGVGGAGSDGDVAVIRSTDSGATWSTPAALKSTADTDGAAIDAGVQLATDGAGEWVAVWTSMEDLDLGGGASAGTDGDIFFALSTDAGATWSAVAPVNTDAGSDNRSDSMPRVAGDGQGSWIVGWEVSGEGALGEDVDILVARSTDGVSWTAPAPLHPSFRNDGDHDMRVRFAADGSGRWVAAWTSQVDWGLGLGGDADVVVAQSLDSGATWSLPAAVSSAMVGDSNADGGAVVGVDGAGGFLALWHSNNPAGGRGTDWDLLGAPGLFRPPCDDDDACTADTCDPVGGCTYTLVPNGETEICNGVDDDCDGDTDEEGAVGCVSYYYDGDGDQYGLAAQNKCLCLPAAPYTAILATDCHDGNAAVHPGADAYHATGHTSGSFDYDCDGQATKRWTELGGCTPTDEEPIGCAETHVGWAAAVPACGESATWVSDCMDMAGSCDELHDTVTQECR